MAHANTSHIPARVLWDRATDQPSLVRWGGHMIRVTRLASVRDERHAYPNERGPRLTMVVETPTGSATLVFDASAKRWYVQTVDQAA